MAESVDTAAPARGPIRRPWPGPTGRCSASLHGGTGVPRRRGGPAFTTGPAPKIVRRQSMNNSAPFHPGADGFQESHCFCVQRNATRDV